MDKTSPPRPLEILFDVPAFSLTDQNAQPFSNTGLRGKVWIADFIFTQCASSCPQMTQQMIRLQHTLGDPAVHMLSFSVDPTRDTPAVLKQYLQIRGADQSRWTFLTSSKAADLDAVAKGFHIGAIDAGPDHPVQHSVEFLLIDSQQHVRGIYWLGDADSMQRLIHDAQTLAAQVHKAPAFGLTR